jgi:hypothetical protein
MRVIISLAAAALLASAASAAKAPPPMSPYVNALEQCRQIADSAQRLACYDRTAPALVTAARSGEVNVVDRGQLREARRSLFGFSMPKLPFFSGDRSGEDAPSEIQSTITSAHETTYGKYRITIADGNAIWETTEDSISLHPPRSGQKIIIRQGAMGAYFLRIDGQRSIKGRRVG